MTQQAASIQPFPTRLVDLIPRQTNDEVDAGIQRALRERIANEPFIDRRNPAAIRTELQGLKNAEAMQRGNLDATQRKIVEIAGHVAKLHKLLKTYEKQPVNLRSDGAILDAVEKLNAAEKELAALKERATRIEVGVTDAGRHQKEFLAFRTREGYPTNSELLKQDAERAQLEREARTI
jgi:hypothetical protein